MNEMLKAAFKKPNGRIAFGIYVIGLIIFPLCIFLTKIPFYWANVAVAILLLISGFIFFSHLLLYLWAFRETKDEEARRGGEPPDGPTGPIWTAIFLFSISGFIFLVLWRLFPNSDIYDLCTMWSAVYGSVLGTFGLLKKK
jgi:amino acid transporter